MTIIYNYVDKNFESYEDYPYKILLESYSLFNYLFFLVINFYEIEVGFCIKNFDRQYFWQFQIGDIFLRNLPSGMGYPQKIIEVRVIKCVIIISMIFNAHFLFPFVIQFIAINLFKF